MPGLAVCLSAALCLGAAPIFAQAPPPRAALGPGPWTYTTFEKGTRIRVAVMTAGLFHPWSMAFIPSTVAAAQPSGTAAAAQPMGDALITEREGRVRLLRGGQLLPEPIADLSSLSVDQLFDVALHPDFDRNRFVYLTYMKKAPRPNGGDGYWATTALARGRFDGERLVDVEDVFVADAWTELRGGDAARVIFAPDGSLLLSSSHRRDPDLPQRLDTDVGKILRLAADGSVPADNPFVGRSGVKPEIYTYGHRTVMGLTVHPRTGAIWELENGPQGGDEVNILHAGANYGWPIVTYGRDYDGSVQSPIPWREGMQQPELFWVPSVTVSSFVFYTGAAFPAWKDNLFVSAMTTGRVPGTGHLERVVFNEKGELRREQLLNDLHQRIRYVGQGPDGLLYLLTDENDGVLLRIEPAPADGGAATSGSGAAEGGQASAAAAEASAAAGGSSTAKVSSAAETSAGAEPLFANFDCSTCHDPRRHAVGPAYADIAARYDPADEATIDDLAHRIIDGGAGGWGDIPMAAHPELGLEEARSMVRRILAIR
jgi:glucose/arabinose dehydrogenase/cytochrome c551/c552